MNTHSSSEPLLQRRRNVLSANYFHHYDEPLHAVRAQGVQVWDKCGRLYLDCYNNVPSVGHCHPHVLGELTRQASLINSHSRYLDENIVRYAERLLATLPPEIDTCVFVCSGTEANALAYDIARVVTGKAGVLVSDGSYHGNALAVSDFSLFEGKHLDANCFVRSVPVPSENELNTGCKSETLGYKAAIQATATVESLAGSQHGLAMLIIDPIFDAPGIFTAPEGYLRELSKTVRSAGGLVVIDEVQSGLTRLGDNMWGFMDSGIVPDIVTMGKPMGGGYPMAVVAGKREIISAFARNRHYFNTFGGTPVAGAVGNAVLDVIEENEILENVSVVGAALKAGLLEFENTFQCLDPVRGKGLFLGIPVITDKVTRRPDRTTAVRLVNQMKRRGVLISACGKSGNVLKVRPPLIFSKENANQFLETIHYCLEKNEKTAHEGAT